MRARPLLIVQARVGSTRLPGKVLADLCGRPLLAWLLERIRDSELITGVLVATTNQPEDDAVVGISTGLGIDVYRGSRDDVLGRFAGAADAAGALDVARVSADSPLLDAATVDTVVDAYLAGSSDIVQNHRPSDWPIGTAVEVFSRSVLGELDAAAHAPTDREHVTTYAYAHPELFEITHVRAPAFLHAPSIRLCVDTPEDMERMRAICERFGGRVDLELRDVLALLGQ